MNRNVYLALPADLYNNPLYSSVRSAVLSQFLAEGGTLIEPAKQGWSLHEWLEAWEKIRTSLDLLAAWPRPDWTIGRGVYREIRDCQKSGLPVWIVTQELDFYDRFELVPMNAGSLRYFAWVRLKGLLYVQETKSRTLRQ